MSTPSTAVATHPHQYYSHHQSYNPAGLAGYSLNSGLANGGYGSRLASSHSNAFPAGRHDSSDLRAHHSSSRPSADSNAHLHNPTGMTGPGQDQYSSKRKPDWEEFYKNGPPKEVIVIDDDSPEPTVAGASAASRTGNASRTDAATNGLTKHTDKKRRTGQAPTYDPVYQQHTSYSTTQTPYAEHSSGHNTVSTDRTASAVNTTAPTSLGSQVGATSYKAPLEDTTAGVKRKRSTRQTAQEEAPQPKKRHVEQPADPYDHYVPPPNPPIKAKDVYVQVVHDVGSAYRSVGAAD